MKKNIVILLLFLCLTTCGCGKQKDLEMQEKTLSQAEMSGTVDSGEPGAAMRELGNEEAPVAQNPDTQTEDREENRIVQGGPYGEISLVIPDGWSYKAYPIDSDDSSDRWYGVRFWPEEAADGYIDLMYMKSFGVCGTGLETEEGSIAGNPVSIGTYDGHAYWDYIVFREDYEGIVALTCSVESWWSEYQEQVMEILDTISFDTETREGAVYVYKKEAEVEEIGLYFYLKDISSTGATLVFNQYDADMPTGELTFGSDFIIEVNRDGKWEEAPIVVEGEYGFHAEAYLMKAGGDTEKEISWEWLYGALAPGEYRIGKTVNDFRGTGDFDQYTVYAEFLLN